MNQKTAKMEFHISRQARDRYQFDATLFSITGNVIFANFHAARVFAQRMNDKRDLVSFPEQAVKGGQINAMGLIDEILHYIMGMYREQRNREAMRQALEWLDARVGRDAVDRTLRKFVDTFPAVAVYRGGIAADTYLAGETGGVSNREVALEEMLTVWLANMNPAFSPFGELFDDTALDKETAYPQIIASLHDFFDIQPKFGPDNQNLIDMLRAPAIAVPHSLEGQLEWIRQRWGMLLGRYLYRLLSSLDLLKEEAKMAFLGPGPALVLSYTGLEKELERFSQDKDWMPRVVMLAKNSYVWLDQLSKKYRRHIHHLDQIPDEELDTLARWGFNGLWLIGLWERSQASARIKQYMGNPEAVASAYSLYDYQLAGDLGGEEAYQNLRDRAWQRGIRLASDMVPNHMAIDSQWVMNHPDWFVALDYSPYPSYSFNGPDWSSDPRVGVFIEDHYYSHTDAAVVFKRVDRWTGSEKFVYHGNDGTSMPWNDTAQLDYLNPEVREAVIQTILHVARKFPIIRFDAAMTLAKRHYQRLWFPEPGTGGAIPSRAEHGMTKAQFDAAMPEEFWREVVDRVAAEVPDTLLLAEAFWLMEGYFVRTLGMHRVYNSAFMNMLKMEDNAKYRSVMKNTLEFDPEVLKRFVNFMSNPDEDTAIAQFGKDDKYFGVCTIMVTSPGLPMFGHGQIEGYTEKYGMEYRRAYWDESPDPWLIQRHEREIFPLMRKRYLFSGVDNFLLYDFYTPEGYVNEDVLAHSNRYGDERGLVVYNNKFSNTRGWIKTSAAFSMKTGNGDERALVQRNLGEGLGLRPDGSYFTIFREHLSGLEFIRNSKDLYDQGLYVELGAFKYQVFLDFREVQDNEWHQYAHLAAYLGGRGVPSVDEAMKEIFLQPIHYPFKELVNAEMFNRLLAARVTKRDAVPDPALMDEVERKAVHLLREIKSFTGGPGDELTLASGIRRDVETILQWPVMEHRIPEGSQEQYGRVVKYLRDGLSDDLYTWTALLGWTFVHSLGKVVAEAGFEEQSRTWIDEWLLGRIVAGTLRDLGLDESTAGQVVGLIKILTGHQRWFDVPVGRQRPAYRVLESLLKDSGVQQFLQVNRWHDVLWFNREALDRWLWWMTALAALETAAEPDRTVGQMLDELADRCALVEELRRAEDSSGYQIEALLDAAKGLERARG